MVRRSNRWARWSFGGAGGKREEVPIQYVLVSVLLAGGLLTAWVGPDLRGEDDPPGERSPRHRLLVRAFGLAVAACGAVVLVAALLGHRPPPNGDGPLI